MSALRPHGCARFCARPGRSQGAMVAIDVRRDRSGELFVLCVMNELSWKFSTCSLVRATSC